MKKPRPTKRARRPLPKRRDNLPPLRGVNFEDAMRAAMATPLPEGGVPTPRHNHPAERAAGGSCAICGRGSEARDEEE